MNDFEENDFADVAAPVRPEFSVARGEPLFVLLSYPVAFLYTWIFWNSGNRFASNAFIAIFTLIFLAAGEILNRKRRAPVESRIWMGGTLLLLAVIVFRTGRVWEGREILFLHAFAVYWLMCKSGLLAFLRRVVSCGSTRSTLPCAFRFEIWLCAPKSCGIY